MIEAGALTGLAGFVPVLRRAGVPGGPAARLERLAHEVFRGDPHAGHGLVALVGGIGRA
ncbi:hypothetical protein [Actinosynnema sp. NPDC023587]|uniref:hypothetical protein n=1 Tax=Actinosynnema sp. NPDC023587 TaxID=3154695 RepID=UPI0033F6E30E